MTQFFNREQIGLVAPRDNCLSPRTDPVIGITWHWTGEGGTLFKPDPLARLRGIQAYHMDHLGYCDIAYNFAFDADGNLYSLRDNGTVGAHAASANNEANRQTLGGVFLEDSRGMTKAGINAMLVADYLYSVRYHGQPHWWTHHSWSIHPAPGVGPTECCGAQLRAFVAFMGGTDN